MPSYHTPSTPLPETPISSFTLERLHYIARLLCFGFEGIKGQTIENVTVLNIKEMPQAAKFQLTLEAVDKDQKVKIGLGVCQQGAATVGAMLKRLLDDDKKHKLSRGCLVRSNELKLNPRTEAFKRLQQLVNQKDGELVNLINEELFDLEALYQALKFFDENDMSLTEQDKAFKQNILTQNGLIKEILSAPKPNLSDLVKVWDRAPKQESNFSPTSDEDDIETISANDFDLEDTESGDTDDDMEPELWRAIYIAIASIYHEEIKILSYRPIEDGFEGIFIDIENNCFFEYELNYKTSYINYRPHPFIVDLPTEKHQLLERLNNQEIDVILEILLFMKQFGGTLTLLTDEDFEDLDAALEKYEFYPAYEGSCPVLFYETGGDLLRLGAFFFWDNEEMEGPSEFFVDDIPDTCTNNFNTFYGALEFLTRRLDYYLSEA